MSSIFETIPEFTKKKLIISILCGIGLGIVLECTILLVGEWLFIPIFFILFVLLVFFIIAEIYLLKFSVPKGMELSTEDKRLADLFLDLQKDRLKDGKTINLISKDRKLIPDYKVDNFQGNKVKKQIKYNPEYFHENVAIFNDDVLRFVLLHEEAHVIRSRSKMSYFVYISPIIILILGAIFLCYPISLIITFQDNQFILSNIPLFVIVLILALLIGLPILWRNSWDVMLDDELDADNYAAECLYLFFGIQNPAATIYPYFAKEPSEKEKQKSKKRKCNMKIIGTYPPYHPANCVRLEKIREKFLKSSSHSEFNNLQPFDTSL